MGGAGRRAGFRAARGNSASPRRRSLSFGHRPMRRDDLHPGGGDPPALSLREGTPEGPSSSPRHLAGPEEALRGVGHSRGIKNPRSPERGFPSNPQFYFFFS